MIYRALNTLGPISFSLTPRAGVKTLSADDIITYSLTAKNNPFEFVFLAEENTKKDGHPAVILTGSKGRKRLAELMEIPLPVQAP